ncbi:MAG: hypothetical protein F4X82_02400 [Candidatus Spechtbacteria bacterium SB0662_bin_43]|uniref:Uncharacterized protein n=1 Tax=Candidatus Spechtbacteria bacterium SB0662_bin_43 TaxID=2604897 RepID=A0A845DED3_9BACT|nr:hypothetical protein [Candidatus Spechtbacteria bacterium SB0662_bin_43]
MNKLLTIKNARIAYVIICLVVILLLVFFIITDEEKIYVTVYGKKFVVEPAHIAEKYVLVSRTLEDYSDWCSWYNEWIVVAEDGKETVLDFSIGSHSRDYYLDNFTNKAALAFVDKLIDIYNKHTPPQEIEEYHQAMIYNLRITKIGLESTDKDAIYDDATLDYLEPKAKNTRALLTDEQRDMIYNCPYG